MKKRYKAMLATQFSEGALLGQQVVEGTSDIIKFLTQFNETCTGDIERLESGLAKYKAIAEKDGVPEADQARYLELVKQIEDSINDLKAKMKGNEDTIEKLNGPGSLDSKMRAINKVRESFHGTAECHA